MSMIVNAVNQTANRIGKVGTGCANEFHVETQALGS